MPPARNIVPTRDQPQRQRQSHIAAPDDQRSRRHYLSVDMMTSTLASSALPLVLGLNRAMIFLSARDHVFRPVGTSIGNHCCPSLSAARITSMSCCVMFAFTGSLVLRVKTSIAEWSPSK